MSQSRNAPPAPVKSHALGGDFREMLRNPVAFFGGLGGCLLLCGLMVAGLLLMANRAHAEDDGADAELDFVPGAIVKLGSKAPEEEIPEKVITNETRAEDQVVQDSVTEDETPPDEKKEKEKEKEESKKPTPKKDRKLPTSKLPTEKNNPYDDKTTDSRETDPNAKKLPDLQDGYDPFGQADGWAEMAKDSHPWYKAVMRELQNLQPSAYGAKGKSGTFRFQMGVGKDGRVCNTKRKGGTLPEDVQRNLETELDRIKFPGPPPDLLKKMGRCTNLRYTFTWSPRGVK